jgi:glycine/D-amino acid oxidase-like deaminating enzyme
VLVSDLSLVHYPAFQNSPSLPALRERLDAELAECRRYGIHIFVAQHDDGRLTLGDSHEYGSDREPGSRQEIDELILAGVRSLLAEPLPAIESRWVGTYLKSTNGITQVVLQPEERVTLVAAMGGLGMTLCWGLARKSVERWRAESS